MWIPGNFSRAPSIKIFLFLVSSLSFLHRDYPVPSSFFSHLPFSPSSSSSLTSPPPCSQFCQLILPTLTFQGRPPFYGLGPGLHQKRNLAESEKASRQHGSFIRLCPWLWLQGDQPPAPDTRLQWWAAARNCKQTPSSPSCIYSYHSNKNKARAAKGSF